MHSTTLSKKATEAVKSLEQNGWITINKNLLPEAVGAVFVEIMKDMKVIEFIEIFSPNW